MSSSRNAPEWFMGGGGDRKRPETSKAQSRSSSTTPRSTRRKEASNSSERRKKPKHQRKKSREPADFFDATQDTNNRGDFMPKTKSASKKERGGRKQQKKSSRNKQKKPSFVERLFGFASNNSSVETLSSRQNENLSPVIEEYVRERQSSFGSAKSDPNSSPIRKNTKPSHRRTRSDPIDVDHFPTSVFSANGSFSPRDANDIEAQASSLPSTTSTSPTMRGTTSSFPPNNRISTSNHSGINSKDENAQSYSGTESDDVLVYSEDESTGGVPRSLYPIQTQKKNNAYPYQGSYNQFENVESQQVMEQNQMMAIAPNHQVTAFGRHSLSYPHSHYGSIHPLPQGASSPPRSKTPPRNEFYFSEDDTLLSESSKSFSLSSRGARQNQSTFCDVSNIIPEEENESTNLLSPTPSANNMSTNSERSKNSKSGSSKSGKRHSKRSPPSGQSSTSGSSSDSVSNQKIQRLDHSPIAGRDFCPPPVKSVSIHARTVSTGTATTASMTYSPHSHSTIRVSQSFQRSAQNSRFSRKQIKQLTRLIVLEEMKEDKIQSIIRDGQGDALDWSQHVVQEVRGVNRPAGFFPHKKEKTHDVIFAVIFLLQMFTVLYIGWMFSGETMVDTLDSSKFERSPSFEQTREAFDSYTDDPFSSAYSPGTELGERGSTLSNWAKDIHVDYSNALQLAFITGLYATSLSALGISMMMILGESLIPSILSLVVIICFGFGTIGIALSPYSSIPIVGIILLAVSFSYSVVVWERIPFAATNLDTALCGVKCSADVLLVGLLMMICAVLWTIGWSVAFMGIYDHYLDKAGTEMSLMALSILFGLFISYFWTLNVMKNIIHVTVAGVVASWWTDPDSVGSCCNTVLRKQFALSLTSSFGSICLGSFVAPTLEVMRHTIGICGNSFSLPHQTLGISTSANDPVMLGEHNANGDPSNIALLPVPKSPLDGCIKHFNDYGFTYMGIYRESFHTSSRKAREVFETREWVGVISDKLIDTVLAMMIVVITLASGGFGLVVEEFDGYTFTNFQKPTSTAFFIGAVIGWVVSSVCLKVVSSSVSTVFVCFSLAPWKFHVNHPVLSHDMRISWGGLWLDQYDWLNFEERESV